MAEAVKVIVRCRPMNKREKDLNCKSCVNMDSKIGQCTLTNLSEKKAPPKSFTFDGAYFTDSTTEQIYADIGYPLVENVTEGYNGTIFAYGQTGCGKSFSMQGITDPATQRGIIPRAFDHIFETINVSEGIKYLVHATYLEIYNEEIRDLLGKDSKMKLDLKEHPDRGVYVQGLSMHPVKTCHDCEQVMDRGWKNRSVGSTLMNAESSRSHSIFTIHLERSEKNDSGEEHIRAAKLNLVDLAGSERQGKTGATGDRLKEATKINLSLSALGNVISALVDAKTKHIPYRDSRLTRLLQDSLGGNTKTLMVACLSPADNNYDETLSTLRYANRAKNIKNKPKINEDPKDALLREYSDEIAKLKAMLRGEIPIDVGDAPAAPVAAAPSKGQKRAIQQPAANSTEIQEEKQRLKEEYEEHIQQIRQECDEMKISKDALQEEMAKLREHYDHEMGKVEQLAQGVPSPGQQGRHMDSQRTEVVSVNGDREFEDESGFPADTQVAQQAVHLSTTKNTAEEVSTPREQQEQAIRRLQELQEQMVGGEKATNEEVKERRRKKKRYAEERKTKLAEEIAKMEGDGIMGEIFESIQDEVKAKSRLLKAEKERNASLKSEIQDLQSEFEYDRSDYLDTIRKQEKDVLYYKALIDKIHPCLRRDCNYANLDRIRAHCEWDEESGKWAMPRMTIEKTRLPAPGIMPGARAQDPRQSTHNPQMNEGSGDVQASIYDDLRSEDRYLQKLQSNNEQEFANNYFASKRTQHLLNKTQEDKSRNIHMTSPNTPGHLTNGSSSHGNGLWSGGSNGRYDVNGGLNGGMNGGMNGQAETDALRAAQVHGQISTESDQRKPMRLGKLPSAKAGRKKKNKYNNMYDDM